MAELIASNPDFFAILGVGSRNLKKLVEKGIGGVTELKQIYKGKLFSGHCKRQYYSGSGFSHGCQKIEGSKNRRAEIQKMKALPDLTLMDVLVEHMEGQRHMITHKSIWHLSDVAMKNVFSYTGLIYLAVIFLIRSVIYREVIDEDGTGQEYVFGVEEAIWLLKMILPYINESLLKLRALFSGDPATTMKGSLELSPYPKSALLTLLSQLHLQEDIEESARAVLWGEVLIEEIEQKVGGLRELEEAGKEEELVR